jgi:hypothetical protein
MKTTGVMPRIVHGCIVGAASFIALGALCSDSPTDFGDNSNCEVIFTTEGQGSNPSTAIKVINRMDRGLAVGVGSSGPGQPIVSVGADMNPETCELYGLFPGLYEVTLQQCEQDEPGSSECTALIGRLVTLDIDLAEDEIETVDVTFSTF